MNQLKFYSGIFHQGTLIFSNNPEEVQKLLNSMLEPDPSHRPQNLVEVMNQLKEEKILNYHTVIEFSELLEKLLSDASNNFPLAIFIDALNPSEPLSEIFI